MEEQQEFLDSWLVSMPEAYINMLHTIVNMDNYFVNILNHYRQREQLCPVYQFQSPELEYRPYLVGFLKDLQCELHFSMEALHLAVFLLDFYMDSHVMGQEKFSLHTLCCMFLAVKFEDKLGTLPPLQAFHSVVDTPFTRSDVMQVEMDVFEYFDFSIGRPTVAHFAQIFLIFLIDIEDLDSSLSVEESAAECIELFNSAQAILTDILDKCLGEVEYLRFEQSRVASAMVLTARKKLNLFPCWTESLQLMTGYTLDALYPCIELYDYFNPPESEITSWDFEDSGDPTFTSSPSTNPDQLPAICNILRY